MEKEKAIPCPFVYANNKRCSGRITRVEAYRGDLAWALNQNGRWEFGWGPPRSHFHLFCSLKEDHSGFKRPADYRMKCYFDELPEALRKIINRGFGERLEVS